MSLTKAIKLAKPVRLVLLGAPGAGKTTQCARIIDTFSGFSSLSSKHIFRTEIDRGSPFSSSVKKLMENGSLIPDDVTMCLVQNYLYEHNWFNTAGNWVLHGLPRTKAQAVSLDRILDSNKMGVTIAIEMKVDQSLILDRVAKRWVHPPSGKVYNLEYDPPEVPYKDDATGEPLIRRDDDNAVLMQSRLDQYNEEIEEIRSYYQRRNVWHEVEGKSSDIIFPKIKDLLIRKFGQA
ncbi:hypothetical protein FT663_01720 [Candidozyma haemuli var. vulneris]|uniref:Adenylate kinase active site lid domain-containing protein n=1 Tax=Candidozyma haemuli TaxID=45357 RepID=A0A2V1AZI0_9ASCO|nr:hypothetical protein CXQ85_002996 [[Candida] haemuloni]KAF3991255.1 hypothetical protein FT662_01806 [[Candida] haemuloni var. vulneris]KAF3993820.1 hypothetical protein FT663_01720 [[Candida] haemuloni var. vulneris]PVH23262.1 hypothetical protein CXQ85_002996 [[Candida] haemuloni]